MTEERKAFEAWATDYFGANVSCPEACFDAWQAALRAQPDHIVDANGMVDHSELVKRLRDMAFAAYSPDLMLKAADALEAIGETK